jgi:hypothetical protein
MCTHICKWKNGDVETIQGMRERRIKDNDGGGEFSYHTFDIL